MADTILSRSTETTLINDRRRPLAIGVAERVGWKALVVVLVIAVVAIGGWVVTRGGADAVSEVQSFVATPKTFNVVLKEKGALKAAKSTDIKCEVEGRSTIISLIPEGTPVQEGDLLVTLASAEIDNKISETELKETTALTAYESAVAELAIQIEKNASDIRKAALQVKLKDIELEKYLNGDLKQKLRDAEIAIEQAQTTLNQRQQDFEAAKKLRDRNYNTQTDFDEANFNFEKAKWDLEKANLAQMILLQYTNPAELAQKESDVEEAKKEEERVKTSAEAEKEKKESNVEGRQKELELIRHQLAKLREQKEKCRIVAPTPGFVVYFSGGGMRWGGDDQQIKEGAEVFERQILMQLPDTSSMMVALRIHEAKTDKLKIDQPVNVTVEGQPGRVFTGKVSKIAVLADSQSSWLNPDLKEYETEVLLDPSDVQLKPGVTAHAEIMVETVEDQLAIPVPAIYAKGGQRYVFRDRGRKAEPVAVQVGAVGNEWAEITSGLETGDKVLLAFGDEHRRMIQDVAVGEERAGQAGQQRGRGRGGPGRGGRPGGKGAPLKQTSAEPATTPAGEQAPAEVATKPAEGDDASKETAQAADGKDTGKPDAAAPATQPARQESSGRTSGSSQ